MILTLQRLQIGALMWIGWFAAIGAFAEQPAVSVQVEIFENLPNNANWNVKLRPAAERFMLSDAALVQLTRKYNAKGLIADRRGVLLVRMTTTVQVPAGKYRILLRSRNASRVKLDGKPLAKTPFIRANASGHESVPPLKSTDDVNLHPLAPGLRQRMVSVTLDGKPHEFIVECFVGGRNLRREIGELTAAIARESGPFRLLAPRPKTPLTHDGWAAYVAQQQNWLRAYNTRRRRLATASDDSYWQKRHELAKSDVRRRPALTPPLAEGKNVSDHPIDRFLAVKLRAANLKPAELVDDWAFIRRVTLDVVGVVPTRPEIAAFIDDQRPDRRARAIDRLLADRRWADHWVGYWQDVLAENPGILKPTLNNTGPFRWWIHESFVDNKPIDRFVSELVMMEGSKYGGGPAGFGMATQNDAPLAAKANVLAKAFLAVELKCARCHDAPHHDSVQRDTFQLAAMLGRGPQKLPKSSTVPLGPGGKKPGVTITLKPGERIAPAWPFAELINEKLPEGVLRKKNDSREQLAALLTLPGNQRFGQVIVNRLWHRYFGRGLVDPVDDWQEADVSHPQLLDYLAREFVSHGYDLKHLARLILTSRAYQRRTVADDSEDARRLATKWFASTVRRRMTAEQIVDSTFLVVGKPLGSERMTLDPEGRRPISSFLNLGVPSRGWHFASLSNERDRPALSLPAAGSVVDLLKAFGWRESRQDPLTLRDATTTVLQPLVLANGTAAARVVRLSDSSEITELCLQEQPLEQLVGETFLRILSRPVSASEQTLFVELLRDGYEQRIVAPKTTTVVRRDRRTAVSWANHLSAEATRLKLDLEQAVRRGEPPTERLGADWRERMEDAVWTLINTPEFIFVP
jgi:hypothetical protein